MVISHVIIGQCVLIWLGKKLNVFKKESSDKAQMYKRGTTAYGVRSVPRSGIVSFIDDQQDLKLEPKVPVTSSINN